MKFNPTLTTCWLMMIALPIEIRSADPSSSSWGLRAVAIVLEYLTDDPQQ
jgi:hypothetical protein